MKAALLAGVAVLGFAAPAAAQHAGHNMPGMTMPAKPAAKASPKRKAAARPTARKAQPRPAPKPAARTAPRPAAAATPGKGAEEFPMDADDKDDRKEMEEEHAKLKEAIECLPAGSPRRGPSRAPSASSRTASARPSPIPVPPT